MLSSSDEDDAGERSDAVWLTVVGFVLLVALTAVGAQALRTAQWDAARARAEADASATAIAVRSRTADVLLAVDAGELTAAQAYEPVQLGPDGVPAGPVRDTSVLADPAVATALARARDSGSMVVSAPVTAADGSATVLVVRATYEVGETAGEGRSTSNRRSTLSGYRVGVLQGDALLAAEELGLRRISDGTEALTTFDETRGSVVEVDLSVLDRQWTIAAPVATPSAAALWLIVVLGAGAALAVAVAARRWRLGLDRGTDEARRAEERAEAVITYAGVVQESHDVGQVVPALAVQLSDRLGLAGVSLSVTTEAGGSRELFAYGDPPDPGVVPVPTVLPRAEGGETIAIHLRRAERSIGVLRVRCGRALDGHDLDQIQIAGELMTSTIVATRSIEQQQDAVDRLRGLDELKTAFLGTASHELRTPVTAISGFSFMLSERWDSLTDEERRVFADRIASNSRALEALVQDLLDFARLERGDLKLVLEPVDLASVTNRVLDRLQPVWSSHTIERHVRHVPLVVADVAALERVVTNLVSNAVKFSPTGSPVRVAVEADGDTVRLVVDDSGLGVPARDRERIFVRFFRGEGEAVLRTSGVGIGLSVVKDFVTQMDGQIQVEDNPTGGARFVVRFAAVVDEAQTREERDVAPT